MTERFSRNAQPGICCKGEVIRAVTEYWNDPKVKKARATAKKARDKAATPARKHFS